MSQPPTSPVAPEGVARLQRWMQAVISTPGGAEAGLASEAAQAEISVASAELESVVLPASKVGSLERLQIYCDQYIWRLERILGEQYASVKYALGSERFRELARPYLAAHPPDSWSLAPLGAHFEAWLAQCSLEQLPEREFLVELARLESTMREVFDAERSELLSTDDVLAIPQESWAEARLFPIAALRLMRFAWPVNAFLTDQRHGREPSLPEAPKESFLVVWRKQWKSWRLEIDPAPFAILAALRDGLPLGEALERAAGEVEIGAEEVQKLGDWFREWSGEGMLSRFELPEREDP